MKHTIEELTAIAYQYFPRGMWGHEPEYARTAEHRRQQEAHAAASAQYGVWRDMLRRIEARLPPDRSPDMYVQNLSLALQSPTVEASDRAYCAYLWLPVREAA